MFKQGIFFPFMCQTCPCNFIWAMRILTFILDWFWMKSKSFFFVFVFEFCLKPKTLLWPYQTMLWSIFFGKKNAGLCKKNHRIRTLYASSCAIALVMLLWHRIKFFFGFFSSFLIQVIIMILKYTTLLLFFGTTSNILLGAE